MKICRREVVDGTSGTIYLIAFPEHVPSGVPRVVCRYIQIFLSLPAFRKLLG